MNNRRFCYPGIMMTLGICVILILIVFMPVAATAPSVDDTNQTPHQATSLVLMYLVGSDLESGNGHAEGDAGTSDLMDMITGYGQTSPDNLNIVVAYGGAAKEGWKGMTIASIEDLKEDARNGVFGDEDRGEFHAAMDMGSKEGLKTFLTHAREQYRGDTTYLIFWNHGDGYQGFGFDENTDNHLSISDITDVLEATGTRTDLIGFDACLMSGLEVARSLEPYAGYMLASEEISAGGWSYDKWVPLLAADPAQSPEQIGRSIISTFIEKEEPLGNTEALINLSNIGLVINGLSDLGTVLDSADLPEQSVLPIARAYEKATRFGENLEDSPSFGAIDLGTLAASLKIAVPDAASASEKLSAALNETVVYVAHDELLGTTTGLSLADPLTVSEQTYQDEADILAISPAWDTFTRNLRNEVNRTLPPSDMVSVGTDSYQIVEPTGSESVSVVYLAVSNETELLQLGTMPLEPEENGTYQLPDWDGEWYYLQDTSDPSHVALIDLYYGDSTTTGINKYISEVDLFRNGTPYDSVLYAYIDPDEDWTKFSLRPYSVMDNETVFSRTGFTPAPGDGILTYASAYDLEGNELGLSQVGAMNLTGGVEIVNGMLPDGIYASALMIETPDGKQDVGDISMISITDGMATPINPDREEGISSPQNATIPSVPQNPDTSDTTRIS